MKSIIQNWIPPIMQPLIVRAISELRFILSGQSKLIVPNSSLKDQGRGRKAFLCATGPSIKDLDLEKISGHDVFSVSNFFLHPLITRLKPKMHFFAPYHEPLVLSNYIEWLSQADSILPPETQIVLGHTTRWLVEEHSLFRSRQVHYLFLSPHPLHAEVDLTKPVLSPQSGPLMILPVLIYMGYSQIGLIGCDHTVLRNFKRKIDHFYDNSRDLRRNASDSNAWDSIIESHICSLNVFKQYDIYRRIIAKRGDIDVYNLSSDSWLDLFPQIELSDFLITK